MSHPAHVVNTGIITSIGENTEVCRQSLTTGKTGIGKTRYLQTYWHNELPVGEVKYTNSELAKISNTDKYWPRTALLSAVAVKEAWQPFKQISAGLRTGFFSATTVGGMDLTEQFFEANKNGHIPHSLHKIRYHQCGAVTELIAKHFHFTDFVTTISTACSSSANSIMMAAKMISNGMLDIAIAGGTDSLCRFTLNGFNTLMILDKQLCKPFDQNRNGLNLGEGAAYIVLMNERAMRQCNATSIATVSGYANTNDAYHQTASSPEGLGNQAAMRKALAQARLNPQDVDYINLHGTGTNNNDSSEGKAIEAVFARVPKASSTKGYTGHTLGASGAIEAVFSILSIINGTVYPNLNWQTQMEEILWRPVTELQTGLDIRHVLSNSFGFGGNCSSLVFSKS